MIKCWTLFDFFFGLQLLVKILETGGFNVDTVKVAEAWRKYLFPLISRSAFFY